MLALLRVLKKIWFNSLFYLSSFNYTVCEGFQAKKVPIFHLKIMMEEYCFAEFENSHRVTKSKVQCSKLVLHHLEMEI